MRQIYYPLILMIIFCGTLHAQDQGGLNPTKFSVIPPTPNAAGISKYGHVPVNLFNGLPNVQVSLGNFSVGDEFSSEISLFYHAGGTRVDEGASFAGLGWSLRAGGVITRTVRGLPDENGYIGQNHQAQIPANILKIRMPTITNNLYAVQMVQTIPSRMSSPTISVTTAVSL